VAIFTEAGARDQEKRRGYHFEVLRQHGLELLPHSLVTWPSSQTSLLITPELIFVLCTSQVESYSIRETQKEKKSGERKEKQIHGT
jgi:hypothetical protein